MWHGRLYTVKDCYIMSTSRKSQGGYCASQPSGMKLKSIFWRAKFGSNAALRVSLSGVDLMGEANKGGVALISSTEQHAAGVKSVDD